MCHREACHQICLPVPPGYSVRSAGEAVVVPAEVEEAEVSLATQSTVAQCSRSQRVRSW